MLESLPKLAPRQAQATQTAVANFDIDAFIAHLRSRGMLEQQEPPRVLVVEDEEDVARSIMFALRKRGMKCEAAASGPEALVKVTNFAPHLILLDLNLPGIDGLEVCLRIKSHEQHAHTKIMVVSARATAQDLFMSKQMGADDHLSKPFELGHLVEKVVSHLR